MACRTWVRNRLNVKFKKGEDPVKESDEQIQAGVPEDASIASPSRPVLRLRGSYSSQEPIQAVVRLRRPPDGDGEPPPPPPPPPPPVSTPDLALQISSCLPAEVNDDIISAVRQGID